MVGNGAKEDDGGKAGEEEAGEGFRADDAGGGGGSVGTKVWGSVEKRLLKRFTGGFGGFDGMLDESKTVMGGSEEAQNDAQEKRDAEPTSEGS